MNRDIQMSTSRLGRVKGIQYTVIRLAGVFSSFFKPDGIWSQHMGRIRQLYQETVSDLQMELKAALVDLGHKSTFDLSLKEAWNPEIEAMGNS
jgi:hypothetical protein